MTPEKGGVVAFGRATQTGALSNPHDHPAFVYAGPLQPERRGRLLAIADRAAPAWIALEVFDMAPRLMDFLDGAFERSSPQEAHIFIAMGDQEDDGRLRYLGDALPGQILITLSGGAWSEDAYAARKLLQSATAHEAAHLWQDAARPARASVPDWIHEGAADAIAAQALVAVGVWSLLEKEAVELRAQSECGTLLRGQALASAERRGDWRASYACGHVLTLIAARARGQTPIDLWRDLAERGGRNGGYDKKLFLSMIEETRGEEFARDVDAFTQLAFAAPEKELQKLLASAGAAP